MRRRITELYTTNRRQYQIWAYLWLSRDDSNSIIYTYQELCGLFDIPLPTVRRAILTLMEEWNKEKTVIENEKIEYKTYKLTFYPNGKKAKPKVEYTMYDELYAWTKEYYEEIDYDYADIQKHKRYVKLICNKLEKAMKAKKSDLTEEKIKDTYKLFFANIDKWWIDNGHITLTTINRSFTKILNQIKTNTSGRKDKFTSAAKGLETIDFDSLANQGK